MFLRGVVQGVGFRPAIYRLAATHEVAGWVRNRTDGLEIEIENDPSHVRAFLRELETHYPPYGRVTSLIMEDVEPLDECGFQIRSSKRTVGDWTVCPPDLATCDECLSELFDPNDRRYRYPFINCTNCGPRFTVIMRLPYDRPYTSMACFPMCEKCAAEYRDPMDRRFHAQPDACPLCGPTMWLTDCHGSRLRCDDPLKAAALALRDGKIVAVKGIGGFHIAADATDGNALGRLRRAKGREDKPFAVMAGDVAWAKECGDLDGAAIDLLASASRPIVIVPKRRGSGLGDLVAPGLTSVGLLLPYSPVHHLLFRLPGDDRILPPLVMTSGNPSDLPISKGNRQALSELAEQADFFLLHDRDIVITADDSVVQSNHGCHVFIRRSRGYVPNPISLAEDFVAALGTGAYLKASPCLLEGRQAFLSQHVGDLETTESIEFHELAMRHLQELTGIDPQVVGCDLNPDFPSSRWANERSGLPVVAVQHHHAHVAAAALECGIKEPVLGLVLDGTGYGADHTIWGCELLRVERDRFTRVGHLRQMPLPGGDAAVKEPWRNAIGLLHAVYEKDAGDMMGPLLPSVSEGTKQKVLEATEKRLNTPLHSSCGRLFDAVSVLLGLCTRSSYEARAPMVLESALGSVRYKCEEESCVNMEVCESAGVFILDPVPVVRHIVEAILEKQDTRALSKIFHDSLIRGLVELSIRGASSTGIERVILSGGCYLNRYLCSGLVRELGRSGLTTHLPSAIPVGDGGISLGQAAVAAWRHEER